MTGINREEEALRVVGQHLAGFDRSQRMAFLQETRRGIFPEEGTTGAQTPWMTRHRITRITVGGREHFSNNLRLAMVCENLGLGPDYYCIIRSSAPNFASKVFLLTRYLPTGKLCIRPLGPPLDGPFLQPQWQALGVELSRRNIPMGVYPPICPICHSHWCNQGGCSGRHDAPRAGNPE